jgi:hypothetical protein
VDTGPDHSALHLQDLEPYTVYNVSVRIKNHQEFGDAGRIVAARTLSAPPGSPPLQLALANITAGTALAAWRPPAKPNGVVYKYVLELAYEDSQGRTQAAQRFQVFNTTEASIGNLLSYTRYRTYHLFP